MGIKAKYQCPACKKLYDTRKEATQCYKSPIKFFKKGDVIQSDKWGGDAYIVRLIPDDGGLEGATLEAYKPHYIATDRRLPSPQRCFMIGGFWCNAKKYKPNKSNIKSRIGTLKKRIKAAEKLMDML